MHAPVNRSPFCSSSRRDRIWWRAVDTPLAREGERSGEVPPLEVLAQHIPIARPGTPEDIANACEFLCSDKASYITGQEINVNGGIYM